MKTNVILVLATVIMVFFGVYAIHVAVELFTYAAIGGITGYGYMRVRSKANERIAAAEQKVIALQSELATANLLLEQKRKHG